MKATQAETCPGCGQPYPVRNGEVLKAIPRVMPMLDGATRSAYYPALRTCRRCGRPVGRHGQPLNRDAPQADDAQAVDMPETAKESDEAAHLMGRAGAGMGGGEGETVYAHSPPAGEQVKPTAQRSATNGAKRKRSRARKSR
jgi:hypothetical protein